MKKYESRRGLTLSLIACLSLGLGFTSRLEAKSSTATAPSAAAQAAWTNLGMGTAGTGGAAPTLTGDGELVLGSTLSFTLRGARSRTLGINLLGSNRINFPFLGGTLVPLPRSFSIFITDSNGGWSGQATLTEDFSNFAGSRVLLQSWIFDSAGPQGWAASNAITNTIP